LDNYPIHIEITPHVHLIRGENQARFPAANTVLIDDEILTLLDAGTTLQRIFSTLKDLGHHPSDIDRIILSHYHTDHKGYAEHLRSISDCEVLCHPHSKDAVASFETMLKSVGYLEQTLLDDWLNLLSKRLPHTMED
jgi:metal-dependent hydrolase (beta-lactamase superfamily II)